MIVEWIIAIFRSNNKHFTSLLLKKYKYSKDIKCCGKSRIFKRLRVRYNYNKRLL